jgi:hypothetical protein
MSNPDPSGYARGHADGAIAGKIDARLAGHDEHFKTINGSLTHIAEELSRMNRVLERQATREATLLLEKSERGLNGVARWAPWQRGLALLLAAVAVAALVVSIVLP